MKSGNACGNYGCEGFCGAFANFLPKPGVPEVGFSAAPPEKLKARRRCPIVACKMLKSQELKVGKRWEAEALRAKDEGRAIESSPLIRNLGNSKSGA